jgi:hypothetical protein
LIYFGRQPIELMPSSIAVGKNAGVKTPSLTQWGNRIGPEETRVSDLGLKPGIVGTNSLNCRLKGGQVVRISSSRGDFDFS